MFDLQEILALYSLNLPVIERTKQTVETQVPARFAFFGTDEEIRTTILVTHKHSDIHLE